MLIKKFEAESMERALAIIKAELGPDALILNTKRLRRGLFRKATVEVTAAFEKKKENDSANGFDEKILEGIFPHRKYEADETPGTIAPPRTGQKRYQSVADFVPATDAKK